MPSAVGDGHGAGYLRGEWAGYGRRDPDILRSAGTPHLAKDGDGYLRYTAFDPATGAEITSIVDVDTAEHRRVYGPAVGLEHAHGAAA